MLDEKRKALICFLYKFNPYNKHRMTPVNKQSNAKELFSVARKNPVLFLFWGLSLTIY